MMMKAEINGANQLEVSAHTNGFKGGDAGYGSSTRIEIKDLGGTYWAINASNEGVVITANGDSELSTLYKAISFIKFALEHQEPGLTKQDIKDNFVF